MFGAAFVWSATVEKDINWFSAPGIWPFNPDKIYSQWYVAAEVTDEPLYTFYKLVVIILQLAELGHLCYQWNSMLAFGLLSKTSTIWSHCRNWHFCPWVSIFHHQSVTVRVFCIMSGLYANYVIAGQLTGFLTSKSARSPAPDACRTCNCWACRLIDHCASGTQRAEESRADTSTLVYINNGQQWKMARNVSFDWKVALCTGGIF